jgi:formate dehydrogenase maturation protein FdhE
MDAGTERSRVASNDAFERRARRAEALAPHVSARAPLDFAAGLYRAQGAVAAALAEGTLHGRIDEDMESIVLAVDKILRFVVDHGPAGLAVSLDEDLRPRLRSWWNESGSGRDDYLARTLLRPYAQVLAARGLCPAPKAGFGSCPFCGGAPWIGCRRGAEGDGAQRFLVCALCAGEWSLNRIRCPACGEEDPEKLPSFQSELHPATRLEACTSCRLYVKSIDLTVDARAIPEVDDLRSLSLDLWAAQEGYRRIEPGLAGV